MNPVNVLKLSEINKLIWMAIIITASITPTSAEEYRVFKNEDGKSLSGKLVRVQGNTVTLKLENGRTITTAPHFFSQEDQFYFKNWKLKKQAAEGSLLHLDCSKKMEKIGTQRTGTNNALKVTAYEGYYTLKIENQTSDPLEKLRLEYRIYSSEENLAKKDRHDVTNQQIDGSTILSIPAYGTVETDTDKIRLTESKLDGGWQFEGGGDVNSSAKMEGIWLRIYPNNSNSLLYEFALPKSLLEKEDW